MNIDESTIRVKTFFGDDVTHLFEIRVENQEVKLKAKDESKIFRSDVGSFDYEITYTQRNY